MNSSKSKVNIGITLLAALVITLATGIILHLKSHGIVIEPRPLIKIIHWVAGLVMVALTVIHGKQFRKIFIGLKQRYRWFWGDTWAVIIFTALTFITGLVKLLSPVKIPHLGLWHYDLGLAMCVAAAIHLVRGLPSLKRLMKMETR